MPQNSTPLSGLDLDQLRTLIVQPTLEALGLWSPVSENLVLGTAITESRLKYIKQLGTGPALGLWQMEPFTHNDIWRTTLLGKILGARVARLTLPCQGGIPDASHMIWNLQYAAAMCRIHYFRIREALPVNTARALAQYWKTYYNTRLGAGTVEKAMPAFAIAVETQ